MAAERSSGTKFEIGHVLFIDIVGYSKLLLDEQRERLRELTAIVLATPQVAKREKAFVGRPFSRVWRSSGSIRCSIRCGTIRAFKAGPLVQSEIVSGIGTAVPSATGDECAQLFH
ncbi:MAG: hypothetical protein ABI196_20880 [Bradyrhizobium sp.]